MSMAVYILVMAGVTHLIRAVPFTLVRKKITSRFIKSFLYYVPYAVLSAMTFPAIFYSTGSLLTACCGLAVAIVLALKKQSLLVVALAAAATALAVSFIL